MSFFVGDALLVALLAAVGLADSPFLLKFQLSNLAASQGFFQGDSRFFPRVSRHDPIGPLKNFQSLRFATEVRSRFQFRPFDFLLQSRFESCREFLQGLMGGLFYSQKLPFGQRDNRGSKFEARKLRLTRINCAPHRPFDRRVQDIGQNGFLSRSHQLGIHEQIFDNIGNPERARFRTLQPSSFSGLFQFSLQLFIHNRGAKVALCIANEWRTAHYKRPMLKYAPGGAVDAIPQWLFRYPVPAEAEDKRGAERSKESCSFNRYPMLRI